MASSYPTDYETRDRGYCTQSTQGEAPTANDAQGKAPTRFEKAHEVYEVVQRFLQPLPLVQLLGQIQKSGLKVLRKDMGDIGQQIGKGAFSDVYRYGGFQEKSWFNDTYPGYAYLGRRASPGLVALKRIIEKADDDGLRLYLSISNEIRTLSIESLKDHKNITELYRVVWEDRSDDGAAWPTLVVEYCPASLSQLLFRYEGALAKKALDLPIKGDILEGILNGIEALHLEGIVHGDVKTDNVLVVYEGTPAKIIPKLSDFGNSVLIKDNEFVNIGGTKRWMAPELYPKETYRGRISASFADMTDLYSYGLLVWVVVKDGVDRLGELASRIRLPCPYEARLRELKNRKDVAAVAAADAADILESDPPLAKRFSNMLNALLLPLPAERADRWKRGCGRTR
ncbi:kinase-like protein [Lentithecium fluviatile CBS 122367]|uniref:Kinase-like protein n=1 Tax=Lentithecium fluviatile CBS 122367 TaxID=1168545 RepID=A0A6G1IUU9_9PLEO|nr:kinase-like protein [Lentithecium fluviatile CBS 122367]